MLLYKFTTFNHQKCTKYCNFTEYHVCPLFATLGPEAGISDMVRVVETWSWYFGPFSEIRTQSWYLGPEVGISDLVLGLQTWSLYLTPVNGIWDLKLEFGKWGQEFRTWCWDFKPGARISDLKMVFGI